MSVLDQIKSALGFKKPDGSQIMPDYPPQLLGRVFMLDPIKLDTPNVLAKVVTVYRCANLIANDIAGLPVLFETESGEEYAPIKRAKGNIVDCWEKANGAQTAYEMVRNLAAFYAGTGNAYLVVDTFGLDNPTPANVARWELFIAPQHLTTTVVGPRRRPIAYVFDRGGKRERIDAKYVVALHAFNPNDLPEGLSPTQPIEFQANARYNLMRIVDLFMKSGGVPPGYWKADVPSGTQAAPLTDDKVKQLKRDFAAQDQGVENWFKAKIRPYLKFERAGTTFAEMQFDKLASQLDADVCMAMGVPPWMIGLKEGSSSLGGGTSAGSSNDVLNYWQNTITPVTKLIESVFTEKFCPMFGEGIRLRFDTGGVLAFQTIQLEQADKLKGLAGRALLTVNEARQRLGEEPVDDPEADELYTAPAPVAFGSGSSNGPGESQPAKKALRRMTADQRERKRKKSEADLRRYERAFASAFRGFFDRQEARVIEELKAEGFRARMQNRILDLKALGLDDPEDVAEVQRIYERLVRERMESAAVDLQDLTDLATEFEISVQAMRVEGFVRQNAARLVTQTSETTKQMLRDALAEGAGQAEGFDDLAARVRAVFDDRRGNALTIARTETHRAYNFSTREAWAQSGVVESQEWLSSRDNAVREAHAEADGQVVSLNTAFEVGGELLAYPGDSSGSAENTINCRCTTLPVLDEQAVASLKNGNGNGHRKITNRIRELIR